MKIKRQLFLLFLIGIMIAAFVYPLLHELGHIIAALLIGGEIKEITLFPLPSILCQIKDTNPHCLMLIAISGTLFPYLMISRIKTTHFWLWYMTYLIKGIVLFSLLLTICSVMWYPYFYIKDDDVTNVIMQYPSMSWIIIPYIIWFCYLLVRIKQEHIFHQCYQYIA